MLKSLNKFQIQRFQQSCQATGLSFLSVIAQTLVNSKKIKNFYPTPDLNVAIAHPYGLHHILKVTSCTYNNVYKLNTYKANENPVYGSVNCVPSRYFSKQKEKTNVKVELEEAWGGPEAFKLILFLKDDFDEKVNKSESILVFFSANWCNHCLKLRKPYGMAALMAKEAGLPIVFATFDINYNPDFAQDKGVVGIPLIKYYKNGKFVTNYKGKRTSDDLFKFAKDPQQTPSQSKKIDF